MFAWISICLLRWRHLSACRVSKEALPLTPMVRGAYLWPCFLMASLVSGWAAQESKEAEGASWWSLQPLKRVELPSAHDQSLHPVDAFIGQALEKAGLEPSPTADRKTLIRRLSYDLLGLAPDPEDVEAFVSDAGPNAWRALVDRWLASPHLGERWGRHWLDTVHFGESNGFEYNQPRNHAWRYRHWVVQALNADMAYDAFARMQLAGDVYSREPSGVVATGFLVTGPHNTTKPSNDGMRQTMRQDEMEDMVALVSQTFLGMTTHCARCHDHKFDPISSRDYYRMAASLAGVEFGERVLPSGSEGSPGGEKAWAVTPIPPGLTHVLHRGEVQQKREEVTPGGLEALAMLEADFGLTSQADDGSRRAHLSDWITDVRNPLFARVVVNRIWMHHFGQGLVLTPNDFGVSGGQPSHPELLDWMAWYLIDHEWSLKALHRLILTSATWQQQSSPRAEAIEKDADNRLLWRMVPRRLEGESLRDTLLQLAGRLDRQVGGVGYRDMKEYKFKGSHFYDPIPQDQPQQFRRTLYRFSPRGARRTLLDTFDCPDPSALTPRRASTTTPLQSLALMNNELVLAMAQAFAERLRREAGAQVEDQIQWAHRYALGREASEDEVALSRPFIEKHGLAAWARVLLNTNELLHVR